MPRNGGQGLFAYYNDPRQYNPWTPSSLVGGTVRRPYLIGAGSSTRNRHRWKRGGRFKSRRMKCITGGNPEKKFVDQSLDLSPVVGGTVTLMSLIPQGDGESQRIGRKATITNVMWKGHIALSSTVANNPTNRVRVCLVWDRSTNGAAFDPIDVFGIAGSSDINAYRDLSHFGRFTILYDKTFNFVSAPFAGNGTTNQIGSTFRQIQANVKCCVPIEFDASATTGAIGTQQVNSLHLLTYEEAATPATALHLISRIRYVG